MNTICISFSFPLFLLLFDMVTLISTLANVLGKTYIFFSAFTPLTENNKSSHVDVLLADIYNYN